MEEIQYHLNDFDGPLDLLLSLIEKNKIDIQDIPINLICEQYFAYIQDAQDLDLDVAGEFLVMGTKLMVIKSRMLLPHAKEDDPRKPLVDQLELYQAAKEAAAELRPLYDTYSKRFEKEADAVPPEKGEITGLDVDELREALNLLFKKINAISGDAEDLIAPLISIPRVSVEEKMREIIAFLEGRMFASLLNILLQSTSKADLIARFMAVLELIKIHRIYIANSMEDLSVKILPEEDPRPKRSKIQREYNATEDVSVILCLNPDYDPEQNPLMSEFEQDEPQQEGLASTEEKDSSNS